MADNLQTLRFLNAELQRHAQMGRSDLKSLKFEDVFSTIPHPVKGSMRCGAVAMQKLRDGCKAAIQQAGLEGRLSAARVTKILTDIIVDRYLRQRQELNQSSADRAFSDALKNARADLKSITHYIPCIISSDEKPEEFQIGPIKFEKQKACLARLAGAFEIYKSETSGPYKDRNVEDALSYYRDFNWIAEITIDNADPESSRTKAEAAVELATNFLHMLIGAGPSRHIKIGERHNSRFKIGRFELSNGKISDVTVTTTFGKGYHFGHDWWIALNDIGGDWALPIIGKIVDQSISGKPAPLAQRMVDAAHWYADASQERFPAAQIIKYVTAMERLVIMKKEVDLTKTFCRRVGALVSYPDRPKLTERTRRLARIYNARSRFVHGSASPFDSKSTTVLRDAEEFCRGALWNALNFFGQDQNVIDHSVTDKRLDNGFENLLRWADGMPIET